jgi:hypothetical protein
MMYELMKTHTHVMDQLCVISYNIFSCIALANTSDACECLSLDPCKR